MPFYGGIANAIQAPGRRQTMPPRRSPRTQNAALGDLSTALPGRSSIAHINRNEFVALRRLGISPRVIDTGASTRGREGDSMLVDLGDDAPQVMELLKRMGGRGSVNPETGLREFPPGGISGRGRERGDPRGNSRGGGSDSDRGTTSGGATAAARRAGAYGPAAAPSLSKSSAAPAKSSSTRAPHQMRPSETMIANYKERSLGQPMSAEVDPKTGGFRMGNTTQGFDLGGAVAAGIGLVSPPVAAALSIANKIAGSPVTVGGGWSAAEQGDLSGSGNLSAPGNDGRSGRDATPLMLPSGRAMNQPAAVTPAGFARPSAMSMPASLSRFLNSAMTPLQSRSTIATQGTQGSGPNDREALDYWRNLFTRDFVDDSGKFRPLDDRYNSFLPVEQQWLEQAFGFTPPQGGDTRALLEALAAF